MSRLSIEVTPEQHQRLKAMAALQGKSIRAFVMERLLPETEEEALAELEKLLDQRVAHHAATGNKGGHASAREIFDAQISEG